MGHLERMRASHSHDRGGDQRRAESERRNERGRGGRGERRLAADAEVEYSEVARELVVDRHVGVDHVVG